MSYVAPIYTPSATVKFISGLPHIGSLKTFQGGASSDQVMNYWVMSVGVLAGAAAAFLIACGLLMWIFTCCFCCKCCQRKCYCARCCCCRGSKGKIFYALLLTLGVASLYFGQLSRDGCSSMLGNLSTAMTAGGALLDAVLDRIEAYASHFNTMSTDVTGSTCTDTVKDSLGASLQEISDTMGNVKLPITSKMIDPMIKALKVSSFPPDSAKLQDGEGLLSFAFDSFLAVIGLLILLLVFFACFANYRSKCSDKGCCRCIKCCYIFLVLLCGTVVILLNVVIGAGLMGVSVAVSDMCFANPDTVFGDLFAAGGLLASSGAGDFLYWTTCTGTNPLAEGLAAIETPMNALSNVARNGAWDALSGACQTATASLGKHVGTNADGKGCSAADGSLLAQGDTTTAAVRCISRQTIFEFNDLMGCPNVAYTSTRTGTAKTVPKGALNAVYNSFVYDALCTDLVGAFFYLWVACSLSSFFILFAFFVLPCTSRGGGASKKTDAKDDEKANNV